MTYTRVNWKDLPDTSTPITAENLNKMDIYGAILGKALYTGAIDLAQAVREVAE